MREIQALKESGEWEKIEFKSFLKLKPEQEIDDIFEMYVSRNKF